MCCALTVGAEIRTEHASREGADRSFGCAIAGTEAAEDNGRHNTKGAEERLCRSRGVLSVSFDGISN